MEDTTEVRAAIDSLISAILSKDIEAIQARYLHEDRLFIFLEGWYGKIEGFDREPNAAAWSSLLNQVEFSVIELTDDAHAGRIGDMGWVGASTRSVLVEPGADEPTEIHQRATWIMEKHSGEWRIVHEHVSFPTDAPYGAEELAG